ncbi:MAG: hypothetical protein H0X31_17095 [Nostocaceae cyanobacterium]|nr:hypothetical protein [Nostocaceae cyanobacterium]
MKITLDLEPEIEARLIAQVIAQGISVEAYLQSLIRDNLTLNQEKPLAQTATEEDWETTLQELGKSPSLARVPFLSDQAISRESIYREREDSQL